MADDETGVPTVNARHDIGLVAAARLVAIFWAGLIPIVLPAWLVIQAEIRQENSVQDGVVRREYVSRSEFEERMRLLDERAQTNSQTLKEIRDELKSQREMLERLAQKRSF